MFLLSYHNLEYVRVACDQMLRSEIDALETLRHVEQHSLQFSNKAFVAASRVLAGVSECKSVHDQRDLGRRRENELIDALLSNTQCKGITIMREPAPGYDDDSRVDKIWEMKRRSAHWDLQMDYNPGSKTYGWVLFPNEAGPMSAGPSVRGEGDSAGNAYQICVVITKEPTTNK